MAHSATTWIATISSRRWQIHAFCLMRNHYHLVVETPNANRVAGMQCLQST
jgi:REP element-mobilizing transposase RayT